MNGTTYYCMCVSYHLAHTYDQLFSPYTYYQVNGGHSTVHDHHIRMHLKSNSINIYIHFNHANIPVIKNCFFEYQGERKVWTTAAVYFGSCCYHKVGFIWIS